MSARADGIVADYLERLEDFLVSLPRAARRQLLEDIADHIAQARQALDPGDEVGLLSILDDLGDPEAIAEEALGAAPVTAAAQWDRFVPWLVLFGGVLFGVGWLVGVFLLWSSATWRLRDKLLATLVFPGGLLLPVLLLGMGGGVSACSGYGGPGLRTVIHCTTNGFVLRLPLGIATLFVTIVGPFLVAAHLDLARRRTSEKSVLA